MAFLLPLTDLSSISCSSYAINRPRASPPAASSSNRARVWASAGRVVKDRNARVIRVSDPVRDKDTIFPLLSGPELRDLASEEAEKEKDGVEDRQKYYVNLGYAIRTLREDLPEIFYREPSPDIYRDDIIFKDPINTFTGIENYKVIFWALRLIGRIFFKTLWVDIVSVWQPFENVVMIRWTAHGIPRVSWESHGRFDGTSEYKLDKEGKIYEHRVDNIAINSPPKFRVCTVEELIISFGCPSTPKPTCYELVSTFAISYVPFPVTCTWMRYYLALCLALAW